MALRLKRDSWLPERAAISLSCAAEIGSVLMSCSSTPSKGWSSFKIRWQVEQLPRWYIFFICRTGVFGGSRLRPVPLGELFCKGRYRSGFYLELQVLVHLRVGQFQDNGSIGIGGHFVLVVDELQALVRVADVLGQVEAVPLEHKARGIDVALGGDVLLIAEPGLGKAFKALQVTEQLPCVQLLALSLVKVQIGGRGIAMGPAGEGIGFDLQTDQFIVL